ncbi:hypothetical protein BDZ89DRAFT_940936 [Hymenopellis radicata]|nr:hypothetical protein BDZ89DRAFT_940936 [Hymenopellis radicata]
MPASVPSSLNGWWCPQNQEYGFVGFSYAIDACQDIATLKREFKDIRYNFNGRYVRLYGACDRSNFYDDVVNAAWEAGLGVHALIWFGFDGGNAWQARKDHLVSTLYNNPKAKFVTRVIQFGSEPLFDYAMEANALASQVWALKSKIAPLGIAVTISELAYGFQERGGAPEVMKAIDVIDGHMLPFFSYQASTASNSWPLIQNDLNWFIAHGQGKKIYLTENGWPSQQTAVLRPNNPHAVANTANEQAYFNLLDSKCSYFKSVPGGGVGWFAHLYSDRQQLGYGIYNGNGQLKFPFKPRTSC